MTAAVVLLMLVVIIQMAEFIMKVAVGPTSTTVLQTGIGVGMIKTLQMLFLGEPKMVIPDPTGLGMLVVIPRKENTLPNATLSCFMGMVIDRTR